MMSTPRWHIKQAQRAWNAAHGNRAIHDEWLDVDGIESRETRARVGDTSFLGDQNAVFSYDEIAAGQVDQRPGVLYVHLHAAPLSQLSWNDRQTTQDETDALIIGELADKCPTVEREDFLKLVTTLGVYPKMPSRELYIAAGSRSAEFAAFHEQRGGIHSEPLVRILAYRMWGDRDRKFDLELERTQHFQAVVANPAPAPRAPLPLIRMSAMRSTHEHQAGCDDTGCDGQCVEGNR